MRTVLGLVPARGGSKEIPGKNLRLLAGRPLLAYTIDVAVRSGVFDRLVLSTDSEEIAALGSELGLEVPFLRPAKLGDDKTPMVDVVKHAVLTLEDGGWSPTVIVLLQPTSPLREPQDIVESLQVLELTGCDSVVSVTQIPHRFAPHYVMAIVDGKLVNFLPEGRHVVRRQDVPPAYARDGNVYAVRRDVLIKEHSLYGHDCRPLILPAERCLTLDSPKDWEEAERMLLGRSKPSQSGSRSLRQGYSTSS